MKLDINLTLAEALVLKTVALNLSLILAPNFVEGVGAKISSVEISEASLDYWLTIRNPLTIELLAMGMPRDKADGLVDKLFTVLGSKKKVESSAIKSVLRRA